MKYLIANWKANLNFDQVGNFCREWLGLIEEKPLPVDCEVVVATTSVFYAWLHQTDRKFSVGLQDISQFSGGAHTGEVTITNLVGLEPKYMIIGHSERRRDFGETNQLIVAKAKHAWDIGSIPVICFDLPEMPELAELLTPFKEQPRVLAYEPVSAISTSGHAGNIDPQYLAELMPRFRIAFGSHPVIYGGSVKPDNAHLYAETAAGLLVGGASLEAEKFYQIVQAF
jgi:triosephosphate isomerase